MVVKVASEPGDSGAVRLVREARALGTLDHPHIARIHDFSRLPDGRPYLVLEYAEGGSLSGVLEARGSLPVSEAHQVAAALLSALDYAHRRGVIHRDIKPSNVLLREDELSARQVLLTDFGVLGELREDTGRTSMGQFVGTPTNMSPEQILGRPQDPRTDVYGIGALLFRMIYGVSPYEARSVQELFGAILASNPVFPETPRVPDAARSFIRACLAKNPEDRPQSASNALAEVQKLLSIPQEAAPASRHSGFGKPGPAARSVVRWVVFGMVAIVAVALLAATWTWQDQWTALTPIAGGSLLVMLGVPLGMWLRRELAKHQTQIEKDAGALLLGAQSRTDLTKTLAFNVDQLIAQCQRVEERILGLTMAHMVDEYHGASSSGDRQAALLNVVELLEKLTDRLSPWYVRQQKLLAFLISSVTVISGVVSIASGVLALIRSTPT